LLFLRLGFFLLEVKLLVCPLLFLVFALPPAESPSTMNSSHALGSFDEQSASFPGRDENSRTFFLLTSSLAFLAASLAFCACCALSIIDLTAFGLASKCSYNLSYNTFETIDWTSGFPNLSLVWPSNWGSGTFILTIAVIPSLTSFPVKFNFLSAGFPLLLM